MAPTGNLRCTRLSCNVAHVGQPRSPTMKPVPMKPITLLALTTPFLLAGCNAAMWGNLAVLAVTFGIFFGTLGLGRNADAGRSRADASTSVTPGHR